MAKYSTEELVGLLEEYGPVFFQDDELKAIIARLRAADELCAAGKEAVFTDPPDDDDTHPIATMHDEAIKKLREAIAKYEED